MIRVALIDYRAGNLTSVKKAFASCGADVFCPAAPAELDAAAAIVVPGVGHFAATAVLDASWRDAIDRALGRGRPLLGICLGLQWLFEASEEAPGVEGFAVLPGRCLLLGTGQLPAGDPPERAGGGHDAAGGRAGAPPPKVPHVGWNGLQIVRGSALLEGVASGDQAYFTHSYAAPCTDATVATTTHGETFASIVERGRVFGVQFHPEKSGRVGLRVLRNFLAMA